MGEHKGTPLDQHIGAVLKAERERQGFLVAELAKRVGVAVSTVYYMESGETGTRVSTLVKFCAVLRVRMSEVVFKAERKLEREVRGGA